MPEEATTRPDIQRIRKIALGVLFILWVLSILVPPWESDRLMAKGFPAVTKPEGYAWIFEPPRASPRETIRIDYGRLALGWFFLGSVAGAIFYLQRQKR